MPFLYVYVCDLLEKLGELFYRGCPVHIGLDETINDIAVRWFRNHKNSLNQFSVDATAVMMMIFTPARTDRDYGLDAERLEQLISRVLNLPRDLCDELQMWRNHSTNGDLAACLEGVMNKMTREIATRAIANKVTVEQIDQALLRIASHNPNSSDAVKSLAPQATNYDTIELLGKIYRSLGAREAKWLTRLILKDYGPIQVPERLKIPPNLQQLPTCVDLKGDISTSEAFPALRDGMRVIRGSRSVVSTIDQLPATPLTALTNKPERITTKATSVNLLPTPSTTAPQPSSSGTPLNSTQNSQAHSQTRKPLAPLNLNSKSASQSSGENLSSSSFASVPTSTHYCRKRPSASQPPFASVCNTPGATRTNPTQPSRPTGGKCSIPMVIKGTGTCRLTTKRCSLSNCIFLLAPCIALVPWITENLLSWHGSRVVTSLHAFSDHSLPQRCPQTGKKYRKIALVEPNRLPQTVQFLKRVESLNMRRSKGGKFWVEVFDWRILECIAKVDRGKELGYNPWRRCWIGAV